jgi:hypothetical protein
VSNRRTAPGDNESGGANNLASSAETWRLRRNLENLRRRQWSMSAVRYAIGESSAARKPALRHERHVARAAQNEFWNIAHQARIRAFLARLVDDSIWFSRLATKGGVTKKVFFGTWHRVSRRCSKTPKFARDSLSLLHRFCGVAWAEHSTARRRQSLTVVTFTDLSGSSRWSPVRHCSTNDYRGRRGSGRAVRRYSHQSAP